MKKLMFVIVALFFLQGAMGQEMRVISFNIRYNSWNNIDGENGWIYRRAAVVRMVDEERPAAIGLQEALIDQLRYLDSCLPAYRRVGVGRDDGKEEGEFMAVYYDTTRLKPTACSFKWLSEHPDKVSLGWDAACRRYVTIVRFRDLSSGKVFDFMNTHLDHVGKTARAEGCILIASLVSEDVPVILGGDMNSTIDDTIFQAFYNVGLGVARDMTSKTSRVNTYNAFGKGEGSLIDHFFVRGMRVDRFRTLDGDYGAAYISDHYPIEIVVRL